MSAYSILGVKETDSIDTIKKAFRKLAMKHHPDRGGSADKFKSISTAMDWIEKNHGKQNQFTYQWDEKPAFRVYHDNVNVYYTEYHTGFSFSSHGYRVRNQKNVNPTVVYGDDTFDLNIHFIANADLAWCTDRKVKWFTVSRTDPSTNGKVRIDLNVTPMEFVRGETYIPCDGRKLVFDIDMNNREYRFRNRGFFGQDLLVTLHLTSRIRWYHRFMRSIVEGYKMAVKEIG